MTLRTYLWGIGLSSFLALASFLAILYFFSPKNAAPLVVILLFFSLFTALCGFFSLINLYLRRRKFKSAPAVNLIGASFREGTLLSILLVGFLLMRFSQVFYWWTSLIFLIIIVAIEAAFLYKEE